MESFIIVDNVTYTYPTLQGGGAAHPALEGLSLQIGEGEFVAVVGANGSGKSTLARHLNALLVPDVGSVRVADLDTRKTAHHPQIRRLVGMVFQRPEDQAVATLVEHDVAFGPENMGLPPNEIRERVDEALHAVDLWESRLRPPHMLSAGQMQRLALAGVLAMRPRCIIFDEVTAMLDPTGRRAARDLMHRLHGEGLTIIAITHLMEEALEADRIVVLHRGGVVLEGRPESIFRDPKRLQAWELDVPPVTALAHRLCRRIPAWSTFSTDTGTSAADVPILTVPHLVAALDRLPHRRTAPTLPPSATGRSEPERSAPFIEATALGHTYMQGTPFAHRALHDVDLAIHRDVAHGLIGATGAGKSTLFQHLNGLLRPQEGQIRINDYDLTDPDTDVQAVRRLVGLVFQMPETQIFEQYVGDEIAYGPRLAGLQGETLRDRVRWAMALVGLDFDTFKDRYTFALSGGEKRKVALASTLALRPGVLLLDEPTAGLDPASRREIIGHLLTLRESGTTLALSSHHMEDVAHLTRQVTVMAQGTTVLSSPVTEVFEREQDLRAWGLGQPTTVQVAQALRSRGWPLPPGLIEAGTLVDHIVRLLEQT